MTALFFFVFVFGYFALWAKHRIIPFLGRGGIPPFFSPTVLIYLCLFVFLIFFPDAFDVAVWIPFGGPSGQI